MKIGNVELASNLLLCPIAGYCDLAYRLVVRPLGGLGLAFTDLVNPRGLKNQTARSMQIVRTCADDQPLGIQLYGTDPNELAEASVWCAENGATTVDINMGCPVPKVAGKGGGSGLLRCEQNAVAIARAVVRACPLPVTVKTRLGWERGNLVAPALAKQFQDVGVAAVTIHGRYGEQQFSGVVDREGIARVVEAVDIPVIGNGDIRSPEDARSMIAFTGCAGVMIGRWALADPWIFRDTLAHLLGEPAPSPVSRPDRLRLMVKHFENMIEYLGERRAVTQFRKRMSWYAKTLTPCPKLRRGIPTMNSTPEFYELVGEFARELDALGERATTIESRDVLAEAAA